MTPYKQSPNPSMLLSAIRAIGYSFETAVADIIDNSISAKAKNVWIYSEPTQRPYFAFLDDGTGMDAASLKNAMLLGSDRTGKTDGPQELGRFGLGLKSASFSQCRKFSVVTKQNGNTNAMSFSLDDVANRGEWCSMILSKAEYSSIPEYTRLESLDHGTLVVWENFDKISKNTSNFELSFRKAVKEAKGHVEYVFHRFYGDVDIYFNEIHAEKRDPFLLDSYGMQQQGRGVTIEIKGSKVHIVPYSLPYANSLTPDEKKLLGNPNRLYDQQGLYLYRNKRLIAWGSWFRTEVRSEFSKLARVQVDIPSTLDDIWMLDVKKSSAKVPDIIRNQVSLAIKDSIGRSRGAVSKPGEREMMAEHKVWIREVRDGSSVEYSINRENPTFKILRSSLPERELALLEGFVLELQNFLPKTMIHLDQASDVKIVNGETGGSNIEARQAQLISMLRQIDSESDRQVVLKRYLSFETYRDIKNMESAILKEARHG